MSQRRSIRRPVRLRGRALLSGSPSTLVLEPASPGSGWVWRLGDGPRQTLDPAQHRAHRGYSALEAKGSVRVCEHVLAALLLADIDDVQINFDGPEPPFLDGSALPFLKAIRAAGLQGQPREKPELLVSISWQGREASWSGSQVDAHRPGAARTFLHQSEITEARRSRRFPGAVPGSSLVLAGAPQSAQRPSVLYGGRPRLRDEPLQHKLLDLLGDLAPYRARGPLAGRIHVEAPSHIRNREQIATAWARGQLRSAS